MPEVDSIQKYLLQKVSSFYGFSEDEQKITQLSSSFTQVYKLIVGGNIIIIKIYNEDYKTRKDVIAEINILKHLIEDGAHVNEPMVGIKGDYIFNIENENRFAVGFKYFDGKEIVKLDETKNFKLGSNLAEIHAKSQGFNIVMDKPKYDIDTLWDEPIKLMTPYLTVEELSYLEVLREKILLQIEDVNLQITKENYGVCHGDYISRNTLWDEKGSCQTIDFEFFSKGYRAYDISHYKWQLEYFNYEESYSRSSWSDFLKGYNSVRNIFEQEMKLVDVSLLLYHIFMAGERVKLSKILGEQFVERPFWDKCMEFLYRKEEEVFK
ncbi:MAG: phosphotransferase [Flavobacteriales bacterium]|nr:phosphotransferase [Flavobacteriales bacterium]MCB9364143.1 phosphotransferase [Flavobacteriales bacterium]